MKNRNITKDEIYKVTELCKIREQAFFTIMRQSGLTPLNISQLKIKHIENILEPEPPIPCKIDLPQKIQKDKFKPPAFIGKEATKSLKLYLKTERENLTDESLLFTAYNNPNKKICTKDVSRAFKLSLQKLKKEKIITYEERKGEPSELRLFSLIKFYEKNAKDYLTEAKNDTNQNEEFYKKLYKEKAMPNLEIETPTTTELKNRIEKMDEHIEFLSQILYQIELNEITKPPEERMKAWILTPEAYKIIRIEDEKSNKKPSEKLRELNKKIMNHQFDQQNNQTSKTTKAKTEQQ